MPYYSTHTGAQVDSAVDKINGLFDGSLTEAEKKAIGANIDLADNAELTAELTRLAETYAFGGVATPSTNPGTPEVNTFYIATEAGTYANMGGVVVGDFEVAVISWNGSSWAKINTGIANKDLISGYTSNISDFGKLDGYYSIGGDIVGVGSGLFHSQPILLHAGDVVNITTNSTTNVSVISEVDPDGAFIMLLEQGVSTGAQTFSYTADREMYVVASFVQQQGTVIRQGLQAAVSAMSFVNGGDRNILWYGFIDGSYYNVGGELRSQQGFYRSNPIHLNAGDTIELTTRSTANIAVFGEFDKDGNWVSLLQQGVSTGAQTFSYTATREMYVVASCINKDGRVVRRNVREAVNELWGGNRVKMLAIGASLTAAKKWQYYVGDAINAEVATHALGGSSVITQVDGDGSFPALTADDVRDVDIVIIFGAFNDYRDAVNNLGAVDDMYPAEPSFIGKLNYAVKRIYECARNADNNNLRVVLMSPYNFGGGSYCNATGLTAGEQMFDGFKACSLRYSAQLIDLLHCGQIAEQNWDIFCLGAGAVNQTYLPYIASAPYGVASIFPSQDFLPNVEAQQIDFTKLGKNDGGYNLSGGLSWAGSFFHTDPVHLNAGDSIEITTSSTPNVSVFSEVDENGAFVRALTAGETKQTYTYTAAEAINISVTFVQQDGFMTIAPNSSLINGMLALVAADNAYGYTYSEWNNGSWVHGIEPWSGEKYPPYAYLWRDYIHLNDEGHKRIAKYIASQLKPIK